MCIRLSFRKLTVALALWSAGQLFFTRPTLAHLGTVRSLDPNKLPQNTREPIEYESVSQSSSPTAHSTANLSPPGYPVDRPWILTTPGGPTAYTLDHNRVEFTFNFHRIQQMLDIAGPYLGLKTGFTDSLTGDGEISTQLLNLGLRWNISNQGSWSYSVRPWFGLNLKSKDNSSYSSDAKTQDLPLGVEVSASNVLDDENRLHLSIEGGHNLNQKSYSNTYYSTSNNRTIPYSYSSSYNTDIYAARASATYEHRIGRKSGLVIWLAPEYISEKNDSKSVSSSEAASSNQHLSTTTTTRLGLLVGTGYQYLGKSFGAAVGLSAGPQLRKSQYNYGYSNSSTHDYSSIELTGALTGSVVYQL